MTSQLIADSAWLHFLAWQPPDACCCNADCPGTGAEQAGQAAACEGCPNQAACASAPKGPDPDLVAIEDRMRSIKHKILVLSGKGGVGKSTFSAQLAFALASHGRQVCAQLHMHHQPQPEVLKLLQRCSVSGPICRTPVHKRHSSSCLRASAQVQL